MKVLLAFGTRPEAIKMAPVALALLGDKYFDVKICVTGQHRDMLDQVLSVFGLEPDFDLNVMSPNQDLTDLTTKILQGMKVVFDSWLPDILLVHGDTATAFATTLAAFYRKVKVGHVEAGLRTNNIYSPWPEEANRQLVGVLSNLHFAPTEIARQNLIAEGKDGDTVYVTGNTVVDAMALASGLLDAEPKLQDDVERRLGLPNDEKKLVLITAHRRENFGEGFESIWQAIRSSALKHSDVNFVIPVHPNPNSSHSIARFLSDVKNVFLIKPLSYLPFIYLMKKSAFILTDSGGIQEEAPSFGKPVLVMRDSTERPEAIIAGSAKLIGNGRENIESEVTRLLKDSNYYLSMSSTGNPFGDGLASERMLAILKEFNQ